MVSEPSGQRPWLLIISTSLSFHISRFIYERRSRTSSALWWPFICPPRIYLYNCPKPPRQAGSTFSKGPFCSPGDGWLRPGAICSQCPQRPFSADTGGVGVSPWWAPHRAQDSQLCGLCCPQWLPPWQHALQGSFLLCSAFSSPLAEFAGLCSKYFTCTQILMSGSASGGTKST